MLRRPAIITGLIAIALIAFGAGFVRFAIAVSGPPAAAPPSRADGIVVFTGPQDRIAGAVALLAQGRAQRLLISGVHPNTTASMLSERAGIGPDLLACCVDLGHEAIDTTGNAAETAAWARKHGFASLIVVTSSYHMPRSLAELGHALPDARLEGYPLAAPALDLEHWWRKPEMMRLLGSEYVKYLAARIRHAVWPGAVPPRRRAEAEQPSSTPAR